MSYVVDVNKLERGDIILRRWPEDRLSQGIMNATNSNYSHALLYVDYSSVIDAGNIVSSGNPLRDSFENIEDALVLRLKSEHSDKRIIDRAIEYARRTVGTEYSFDEVKKMWADIKDNNDSKEAQRPNRQICTRLVAMAFESAGLPIVKNSSYPTIKDFEESSYLEKVEDCIMEVTPQIQDIINSKSMIPIQTQIIMDLLKRYRNIYPHEDVQTFEQLIKVTLDDPKKISTTSNLIRESGYLDMWKKEEEINPHDFNSELFIKKYGADSLIAAFQSVKACKQCETRYQDELDKLKPYMNKGNELIDILGQLYINLVDQCDRRKKVLNEVIKKCRNTKP